MRLVPVGFDAVRGWRNDDHAAAFRAFRISCRAVLDRRAMLDRRAGPADASALSAVCATALGRGNRRIGQSEARCFFERHFTPHRIEHDRPAGLLTGYYEPHVDGSRTPDARFRVPIYRRPPDLENLVDESARASAGVPFTHMRRAAAGLVPFPTRAQIEDGALAARGLELLWLADPVDAFFAQVQGSARIRLQDGTRVGITYDGKNGHPYTSIGRVLIDRGEIPTERMTMEALGNWLRADEHRGRELMRHNASFVFFRETTAADGATALGTLGTPLVPGRSLAVDASLLPLGMPVWVEAASLRHDLGPRRQPLRRLTIAHDVGSAIRGPERGDLYFGSGDAAAAQAGITRHSVRFHVLLPRRPGQPREVAP